MVLFQRLKCENPANFSKIIAFMAQGAYQQVLSVQFYDLLFVDAVELGDFNPSTSLSLLMLPNLNVQLLSQISEVYSQLK